MNLWGITDVGAVRKQNQDFYFLEPQFPGGALGVVCDGMGGAKAGNIASSIAVDAFVSALRRASESGLPEDPAQVMSDAVRQANELIAYRASIDRDCDGMGTTLVAAWALNGRIHLINVGDSRAYLISEEGISKVTRDHSLVEDLVMEGRITAEEARIHPQKNLITRALGAEPDVEADLYRLNYKAGDFLLLCSDGLSNVVTDQELLYEIAHGGPPETCCERLLNLTLSRGAPDNITAVLFEL